MAVTGIAIGAGQVFHISSDDRHLQTVIIRPAYLIERPGSPAQGGTRPSASIGSFSQNIFFRFRNFLQPSAVYEVNPT